MQLDREQIKQRALEVLARHVGKANAITMAELTGAVQRCQVTPSRRYDESRIVRSVVEQLRREGHPICHHNGKGGGYFLAGTEAELEDTARWFRQRAMSAFRQEAALKRISLIDLVEQLRLDLVTPRMRETLEQRRAERAAEESKDHHQENRNANA
jgi:hypothetical protein